MCGIVGFQGSFDVSLLENMSNVIAHRGPDDHDSFFVQKDGIGLAHRRLSIIDLSDLGKQPMYDATGRIAIVFNGEIYNYRELKAELTAEGVSFRSQSDTEVLLNLYLREGCAMLTRLNGIFAFALWDANRRELFIARDGLGVKPLYFAETNKGFLFGSELKTLLQEPTLNREIDPLAVAHHLTYLWCPAPQTMLLRVKKLEPGTALIINDGKIARRWTFYDLPNGRRCEERLSDNYAVSLVRDAVDVAIRRQMVADVPIGAFLSGGLDSSAVVAFARQYTQDRLQCFTINFEGKGSDIEGMPEDYPYAQRVAKHLGVDLHTVTVGPEMIDHLCDMIYFLDEPQADPAPLNAMFICRLAREQGIKVLLSGAGGDDIFTGYRRHFALLQERYWSWLPRPARQALTDITGYLPVRNPHLRRLRKAFEYAALDGPERIVSYFYWFDPHLLHSLLSRDMRAALAGAAENNPLVSILSNLPATATDLDRLLFLEGKFFLADHNLNYTDKMSMAHGVEVRVPLLDTDLVALAASLPDNMKQRGKTGKWVFKKAMEPFLPRDIIYRPKTGFGAPLRHWLHHELKPLVEDVLSPKALKKRNLFDVQGVKKLIQMDQEGRVDAAYPIFALICIELWCRIFIDRRGTR
jgi:asparagine synthase (glutamine-hydrolysing)